MALLGNILSALWKSLLRMKPDDPVFDPIPDIEVTPLPMIEPPVVTPPEPTNREKLYAMSYSLLSKRLSLNPSVPQNLGCADALSYVIQKTKFTAIPKQGIAGTNPLLQWFISHPDLYEELSEPDYGDIAIAPTGTGNGKIRGHCWVTGKNSWMSNNSESGKWDTQWSKERALDYYQSYGGIKIRYFRLK